MMGHLQKLWLGIAMGPWSVLVILEACKQSKTSRSFFFCSLNLMKLLTLLLFFLIGDMSVNIHTSEFAGASTQTGIRT